MQHVSHVFVLGSSSSRFSNCIKITNTRPIPSHHPTPHEHLNDNGHSWIRYFDTPVFVHQFDKDSHACFRGSIAAGTIQYQTLDVGGARYQLRMVDVVWIRQGRQAAASTTGVYSLLGILDKCRGEDGPWCDKHGALIGAGVGSARVAGTRDDGEGCRCREERYARQAPDGVLSKCTVCRLHAAAACRVRNAIMALQCPEHYVCGWSTRDLDTRTEELLHIRVPTCQGGSVMVQRGPGWVGDGGQPGGRACPRSATDAQLVRSGHGVRQSPSCGRDSGALRIVPASSGPVRRRQRCGCDIAERRPLSYGCPCRRPQPESVARYHRPPSCKRRPQALTPPPRHTAPPLRAPLGAARSDPAARSGLDQAQCLPNFPGPVPALATQRFERPTKLCPTPLHARIQVRMHKIVGRIYMEGRPA